MAGVTEEVESAVEEFFEAIEDMKVVLRKYTTGLTSGSVVSGIRNMTPLAAPIEATGAISRPVGDRRNARSLAYVRSKTLGEDLRTRQPEDRWTIQEPGGQEMAIEGEWVPYGPKGGKVEMFHAELVGGGKQPFEP